MCSLHRLQMFNPLTIINNTSYSLLTTKHALQDCHGERVRLFVSQGTQPFDLRLVWDSTVCLLFSHHRMKRFSLPFSCLRASCCISIFTTWERNWLFFFNGGPLEQLSRSLGFEKYCNVNINHPQKSSKFLIFYWGFLWNTINKHLEV